MGKDPAAPTARRLAAGPCTGAGPGRPPERVLWAQKRREDELRALDIRVVRIADADPGTPWPAVERRLRTQLTRPGATVRRFTTTGRHRGRRHSA